MPTADNKAQAVYQFFSSFGWPAYDAATVPDQEPFPYTTYETVTNGFDDGPVALSAWLWDRSMSWATVEEKAAEIASTLENGGGKVPYIGGALWIKKGSPWSQRLGEPGDDSVRRIVLSFEAEYLS